MYSCWSTYNTRVPQGTQIHFLQAKSPQGLASSVYTVRMKWYMLIGLLALHCICLKITYSRFKPDPSFAFFSYPFLQVYSWLNRLLTLPRLRSPRFLMHPYQKLLYYLDSFQFIFLHKLSCLLLYIGTRNIYSLSNII